MQEFKIHKHHKKLNNKMKTNSVKLQSRVREEDTISPKLLTLVLPGIFKKSKWDTRGINIDGIYLNHLRFVENIVLMANNLQEFVAFILHLL